MARSASAQCGDGSTRFRPNAFVNEPVACHWLLAPNARSFAFAGHYSFHAGACRVSAVALVASAPEGNRACPLGFGLYHGVCGDDTYHHPPRHDPRLLVDHYRQCTSGWRLWDHVGRRADVRWQECSILLASTGVVFWLIACSIDPIYARPEARATVMAAIGIVYTLLVVFELWRGRGDEVWRWPIMVLLLAHAAAIPIHIPLAGAWADPDPSDPSELDLLTFAIFEGAFVCICASRRPSFCLISIASKAAATILYAARGRLIPFNSNSPTGSTFTAFSTFVSTRGLIRICPGLASSHSREATLDTVPMAAESKRPSNRRCRRG